MLIKQTNLNLVYPRIEEYRKKFVNSEELLNEYFMPPTILPIPQEVQDEVPRIIVPTKNGHSMMNISLSVASFTTNYDGEFPNRWESCKDYLEKRVSCVYKLISDMTGDNSIFVGLITNVEIDDIDDNGLEILKKSLFKDKANKMGDLYDLSCKLTYVYQDRYFINIILENLREFSAEHGTGGRPYITGEKKHTIAVSIDVNDRYAANYQQDYKSQKEAFDEILSITSNIINSKLEDLVRKGEFVYDE